MPTWRLFIKEREERPPREGERTVERTMLQEETAL